MAYKPADNLSAYAADISRRSEAEIRSLIDVITETVVLIDPEGTILAGNAVLAKRLGRKVEELRGRRLFDFFPLSLADSRKKAADEVLMTGKPLQTEDEREGRVYRTHWYPVLDDKGAVTQVAVFAADITETRRLEGRLMQAQKMEAIGTLAGGIAHDFNNLLTGIQGRVALMLLDMSQSHPFHEHLKAVEQYVQSAANLTKQLLGFAKGGKYQLNVLDLNDLVKRSSTLFGRTRKEIKIHYSFQEPLWSVEADSGQIEQVLLNLYVNAWQAMPAGGELHLETRNTVLEEDRVRPYALKPGPYVQICVIDTGVGMDPSLAGKIFDPFFSTKGVGKGTGLGLAIAYGIITNHGGFIEVSSRLGEGSAFSLFLPATKKEITPASQSPLEIPVGTETILIVDDEEMILDVTKEILEKTGYKVLTAQSGREAVDLYEKNPVGINMVILDIVMPEMGGEATFNRLQQINPDVKVLLASGYSVEGEASRMIARGCRGFVQKPFLLQELSKKIREVLE
jgi:two-component system cell cycle sensor histidine kinase/response regulator CckA